MLYSIRSQKSQWLSQRATTTEARTLQLLSPRAATTEARAPRARAPQQREATAVKSLHTARKSSPRSRQLEKARVQQRRLNAAKNKFKN